MVFRFTSQMVWYCFQRKFWLFHCAGWYFQEWHRRRHNRNPKKNGARSKRKTTRSKRLPWLWHGKSPIWLLWLRIIFSVRNKTLAVSNRLFCVSVKCHTYLWPAFRPSPIDSLMVGVVHLIRFIGICPSIVSSICKTAHAIKSHKVFLSFRVNVTRQVEHNRCASVRSFNSAIVAAKRYSLANRLCLSHFNKFSVDTKRERRKNGEKTH